MNGFNTKEAKDTMRKCTYPLAGSLRGATASMAPRFCYHRASGVTYYK